MAEPVDLSLKGGLDGLSPVEGPGEGPAGPRAGRLIAAAVAIAASAGLAWWAAGSRHPDSAARPPPAAQPPAAAPAPQPLRFAAAEPDPAQVRQAYGEAQGVYAAGGPDALVRTSTACAKATPGDPQRLDYCLAFDVYASEIVAGGAGDAAAADWFGDAGARGLALARGALPEGVDAAGRLAQVAALAQAEVPKPPAAKPSARPKVRRRPVHKAHRPTPAGVRGPSPPPANAPPAPLEPPH